MLDLAERIVPGANPNVVSDAAAAAGAARGALQAALVNIDANRASITDAALRAELDEASGSIERDLAPGRRGLRARRGRADEPDDAARRTAARGGDPRRGGGGRGGARSPPVLAAVVATDDPGAAWYAGSIAKAADAAGIELRQEAVDHTARRGARSA